MLSAMAPQPMGDRAVLVPVKAFHASKRRLQAVLSVTARIELMQRMAAQVLAAAAPLPVAVVCDDATVAAWAHQHGARVLWGPGLGLNGAVAAGVDNLAAMGVEWVTVVHADLPRAAGIGAIEPFDGVVLVPDREDDGTNVVRLPVRSGFRFSYGPGSFRRHLHEARRLGLETQVLRVPELMFDVDWPADLASV